MNVPSNLGDLSQETLGRVLGDIYSRISFMYAMTNGFNLPKYGFMRVSGSAASAFRFSGLYPSMSLCHPAHWKKRSKSCVSMRIARRRDE
jgi:hypothetical protein